MDDKLKQILNLLEKCSPEQRIAVFAELRKEIPIHPLE